MKPNVKIFLIAALTAAISITASAQGDKDIYNKHSAGIRTGVTGLDATYQHGLNHRTFIEGNLGIDFGSSMDGSSGVKAAATYNMYWAHPAWTEKGRWSMYAGLGAGLGNVADHVSHKIGDSKLVTADHGFMISLVAQAGIEYEFWFPLQISLDIRPYLGLHFNNGYQFTSPDGSKSSIGGKTGFYNRGLLGFIPSLSARFLF